MKKLVLSVFAILCIASFATAEVGIGLRAGGGQDDNNLESEINSPNYSFSENNGFVGLELLWQQGGLYGLDESQIFGVKAGVQMRGELEYKEYVSRETLTNNIYEFPITVYYKYAVPETQLNVWGGLGATIGKVEWEEEDMDSSASASRKNTLVYPHIKGGIEWRPNKIFGLGLDLGYNFGGDFKVGNQFKRDISGFEGAVAARFYFL